jgi:nucleotide-binding universal stress UspA family protein
MRVLVGFDGTPGAEAALELAARLVGECDGELIALHVLNPLTDAANVVAASTAEAMVEVRAKATKDLEAALGRAGASSGVALVEDVERGEDTGHRIVAVADQREVDFVVLSSRRAAGLRGLLGSVAQNVLGASKRPVLIVKPPEGSKA